MKKNIILGLSLVMSLTANAQQTLTLQQVKERAVAHNVSMRAADNAILQAREQKKETFMNYLPQVNTIGLGLKSTTDMMKTEVKVSGLLPSSIASALPSSMASMIPSTIPFSAVNKGLITGVSAIQPVFASGQIVNGNKLAKIGVNVAELQKHVSASTVELTAERYYWQIISLKEKRKTINAISGMLKNLERDADAAVKAGVGMHSDLLRVRLKESELRSNKLKLENGLKLARMVLTQYIDAEGEIDVTATIDPSVLPPYPTMEVDHKAAVATTSGYQLLGKNVEATTLQHKMEEGKRLPTVGVGVGYNYYNLGSGIKNGFGAVFATVSIPISQWWSGSHAIKPKKLAEGNARQQLSDSSQLLAIHMQKNWNGVDDTYKQLVLAKKSIEQSEENLRLNRNFYHAGTVTMNDLLDAQQKYQQCHDKYTEAYATLQTKIVEYEQSIGK